MLDMLTDDGWGLGLGGQARTSTIWPLKVSSAFRINGSFLKSSLLTELDFAWAGGAAVSFPAATGLVVASAGGVGGTGSDAGNADAGDAAALRFAGNSALTNFTCALGNPNSPSLVWISVRLLGLFTRSRCSANSGSNPIVKRFLPNE